MGLGIRTFEQRVTAGNDFDGTLPPGKVFRGDNIEAWPVADNGGLFDIQPFDDQPLFVRSVELKLGGQSSWTVHKLDRDGSELLVLCGTNETDFLTTAADAFLLTAKQKLVVRTTGATAPLFCRVHYQAAV